MFMSNIIQRTMLLLESVSLTWHETKRKSGYLTKNSMNIII